MAEPSSSLNSKIPDSMKITSIDTFLWNLKDIVDGGQTSNINLNTPIFELKSKSGNTWQIGLTVDSNYTAPFLGINFRRLNYAYNHLLVIIHISILDCKMERRHERIVSKFFPKHPKYTYATTSNYTAEVCIADFLPLNKLLDCAEDFVHGGDLILFGEIKTLVKDKMENIFSEPVRTTTESKFRQNIRSLLKNGTFADFTVKIQEKEYHCHKAILASRSVYFDCLLRSDMKESRNNLLELQDIEPDVFEQVLMYIYTNELYVTTTNATPLLAAAEKYLLSGLKEKCEEKLLSSLNFSNFSIMRDLAEKLQLQHLQLRSLQMYAMFRKQFQANSGYNKCKYSNLNKNDNEITQNSINSSISSFEFLSCYDRNSIYPSANVWVATYSNVILNFTKQLTKTPLTSQSQDQSFIINSTAYGICFEIQFLFYYKADEKCDVLDISLLPISCNKEKVPISFQISFCNTEGLKTGKRAFTTVCAKDIVGSKFSIHTIKSLNCSTEFKNCLSDKQLTVKCKAWIEECSVHYLTSVEQRNIPCKNTHFENMYANATLTDIVIKVQNREFACHKAIVACRSPFLAEMLESDVDIIVIELVDIEPEAFENVLTYIYTDKYTLFKTEAFSVMLLAHKFKLEHLKLMCEQCLARSVSIENAVDTLNLSISCSVPILKKHCLQFVQKFLHKILENPQYVQKLQNYNLCNIVTSTVEECVCDVCLCK